MRQPRPKKGSEILNLEKNLPYDSILLIEFIVAKIISC